MNKVILMGRLTREPDVRYSQNAGVSGSRFAGRIRRTPRSNGEI